MKKNSFESQVHDNAVALISLVIAIIALVLNTWRLEQTEKNRNIRQAGFEILKNLGELQGVINKNLYENNGLKEPPQQGWNSIAMMSDMAVLMPSPVPDNINHLIFIWGNNWKNLPLDEKSADEVVHQIDITRETVMKSLNELH